MTARTAPVDIGTLIESIPNVCGGSPVLKGTRMPVKALASHHRSGMDAAELARQFDLAPELVYAGLAFYFANQPAVDAELEADRRLEKSLSAEANARRKAPRSA